MTFEATMHAAPMLATDSFILISPPELVSPPSLEVSSVELGIIWHSFKKYRGLLNSAQNIVKKDPGRAKQSSLATAGTNFTKPGAQNRGDL